MDGGTRQEPCIWFRASGLGTVHLLPDLYSYGKAPHLIREYAWRHRTPIADTLQAIQRRNFYQIRAEASHRGHYPRYCI